MKKRYWIGIACGLIVILATVILIVCLYNPYNKTEREGWDIYATVDCFVKTEYNKDGNPVIDEVTGEPVKEIVYGDYYVPENLDNSIADSDEGIFNPDINYACTVFPNKDNVTYAAVMKNFDPQKEKAVTSLMIEVQNKAAELIEEEVGTVNWFLVVILILAAAAFIWWLVYALTHRRPRFGT